MENFLFSFPNKEKNSKLFLFLQLYYFIIILSLELWKHNPKIRSNNSKFNRIHVLISQKQDQLCSGQSTNESTLYITCSHWNPL